jgi:hypothetical protein
MQTTLPSSSHTFYSPQLTLCHAYLRLNLKDPQYIQEAQTIFEHSLKGLLTRWGTGKVLQTKTFTSKNSETGELQA